MTLKTFLIGMFASFALAWICIIAIPVASMGNLAPVKMNDDDDAPLYQHGVSGRILNGAEIYQSNGCYTCHTQLIRPTYAGQQIWRKGAAGIVNDDGDSRRETDIHDYDGEKYANIGIMRIGPDLSNFAYRAETYASQVNLTPEQWIFEHLFNPRNNDIRRGDSGEKLEMNWSVCPSQRAMFEPASSNGQVGTFVVLKNDSDAFVPKEEARVLASYLLSLKRDDALPASLNHGPQEEEE